MNLHSFVEQEDLTPLQEILITWADEYQSNNDRKNFLLAAGFDRGLIRQYSLNAGSLSMGANLSVKFRDANFRVNNPSFHPLVKFIDHLLKQSENGLLGYELSDEENFFLIRLRDNGKEKLNALRCRSSIVRIELSEGTPIGTGFLAVGNRIITCFHVVKDYVEKQIPCQARFNYYDGNTTRNSNSWVVGLNLDRETMIYSLINDFDYAVIKTEQSVNLPVLPLDIQPVEINAGEEVRTIHHPGGKEAILSNVGEITKVSDDRLWHNLFTEKGSSGAPIFNKNWDLVALHRGNIGILASEPKEEMTATPISCFSDKINVK